MDFGDASRSTVYDSPSTRKVGGMQVIAKTSDFSEAEKSKLKKLNLRIL
jgi:hypothetical protein